MIERDGCIGDHPQRKLRLGGEIIELSNDDKIFTASDDVGDEETTKRGGDEGTKRKRV